MKQKYTIGFIALVLTIVLAGCVHDYPSMTEDGEEGIDPTLVEVNTEVTLDLELVPLEIITQKKCTQRNHESPCRKTNGLPPPLHHRGVEGRQTDSPAGDGDGHR